MIKSLNNNLVLAVNDGAEEFVLFGKGIGFKKKKGDVIDHTLVTKIFESKNQTQNFSAILDNISSEVLSATEKIIENGENELGKKVNASMIVSLSDHIQAAIERLRNEQVTESALQWEIPFLYVKEYEIGKNALLLIEEELGVSLPESEASFIALHFVNAQDGLESMDETMLITTITKSIVKIIQSLFNIVLNKSSIHYSRFVTHIRYFMNRQLRNQAFIAENDNGLYRIIQEQYPKSFACGLIIRDMLKNEYQMVIRDDELLYLVIHIQRITKEN
ncbi:PRD domain-containing protein [Enterococcus sp. AZ126]|uniref:PRD domain-containing protein n=1 Tax=Enterococcus sp. AZ126 TaxID=2774635 RepID=UPI003F6835E4